MKLRGIAAARAALQFARDPLAATQDLQAAFGPFVMLGDVLPFVRHRAVLLGAPLVFAAGAQFHRELLGDTTGWRSVSLLPGGPKNSAARRMANGLMRLSGRQHAHYRKLLAAPLRRSKVEASTAEIGRLAEQEIGAWPAGATIDLWDAVRRVMRAFAVGLLFGGDPEESYPLADMIAHLTERRWGRRSLACPINLPITPYGALVRESERLERRVLAWAESKRACPVDGDLAALIVNNPDPDGKRPTAATLAGQLPTLYAAATEAGQSTLFWSLILLAQHPRVARDLLDELRQAAARPEWLANVSELPLLDAVVKEAMRIIPPVPLQMRVAEGETSLAGHPLPMHTRVVLCAFLTSRMPELYPDGDRFRPERWSTIAPSAFEYPMFGGGPRICPGYWWGMMVVKAALATIITRYRIALEPHARIDCDIQPTARPRRRVRVLIHRQDGAFAAVPVRGNIRRLVRF